HFLRMSMKAASGGPVWFSSETYDRGQKLRARCISPVPQPGKCHCWIRGFALVRLRVAPRWFTSQQADQLARRISPLCFIDVELDCCTPEDTRLIPTCLKHPIMGQISDLYLRGRTAGAAKHVRAIAESPFARRISAVFFYPPAGNTAEQAKRWLEPLGIAYGCS